MKLLHRISISLLALSSVCAAQFDRTSTTETGWWYLSNATTSTISSRISAGYRLIDLDVVSVSPRRYAATFVRNAGSYARTWWYFTETTPANLASFISANNARIIDLDAFDVGGSTRLSAVMVSNTGAQAKAWWYYYGATTSSLAARLTANNARLVDLERYTIGNRTYYAGVMIRNTGNDARSWGWYYNATPAFVASRISSTGMRLVDLERRSNGNLDVVMQRESGKWWWYYGFTAADMGARADQIGARIVDVEAYPTASGTRYAFLLTNNSNALTTRMSSLLRSTTNGQSGVYLKRVGGPVLASLQSSLRHDPASVLKTVHHARAMRGVATGEVNLSSAVNVFLGNGPNSCPAQFNLVSESLQTVLTRMMRNSDNTRTRAVTDRFGGLGALTAFAQARGMNDTALNHHIGCGSPANRTTLRDLGRLHEVIAGGYLGSARETFYDIMSSWSSGGTIGTVIDEEAARVGLTTSQRAAFRAAFERHSKGGSYGWPSVPRFHRGTFAFVRIPFYDNGGIDLHEYVSGAFVNNATNDTNAASAMSQVAAEMLRDEIRAAMRTWGSHVFGSVMAYGAGCAGASGAVPTQVATGTPEIGQTMRYEGRNFASGVPVFLHLGFNRTSISLGAIGARGCSLLTTPAAVLSARTGRVGSVNFPIRLPVNTGLIGTRFYTQVLSLDRGANALGISTTRGLQTSIGGQP